MEGERMLGVKKHRVVPRPEGVIGIRDSVTDIRPSPQGLWSGGGGVEEAAPKIPNP